MTNQKVEKMKRKWVPVFDSMLESVVRMSHLDRFGEVLEAEVVEAFSALLRHCAWAVVTLDSDWSNGLSKDDDLGEVVVDILEVTVATTAGAAGHFQKLMFWNEFTPYRNTV